MSRFCSGRTLLAVIVAMLLVSHAQSAVGDAVTCPRVAFSPVLDSHLDDWPPLPHVVMSVPTDWRPAAAQFAQYGGTEDISAEVRLAWDNQSLYISVVTRDDQLVRVRSAAEIDRGDSIVLALVGEEADEVNQFVVVLLRAASLVWRAEPAEEAGEVRTVGRALAAKADQAGGSRLIYELAIPWTELKQLRPLPGTRFTLTVSVCDDDGDGLKGCLERAVPVVLSTTGLAAPGAPAAPRPAAAFKPSFPSPQVARFDEKCFKLKGADVLLVGGEIQYALLPREGWARRVDLLKSAGLNTVGVTVPWAVHQPTSAPPDLGSLRQFLDLCKAAGLWVQLNIGPFAGETWEAGGVPGWVVALGPDRDAAVAQWLESILPAAVAYQLSEAGPVATVVVRPLPDRRGQVSAAKLESLLASARSAGIVVPVVTWNASAARGDSTEALANIVDTLSFYRPVDAAQLTAQLQTLDREETGPAAIAALPGEQRSPEAARRSADLVRVAVANGAAAVMMSDFAPGFSASLMRQPGDGAVSGAIDPAGALTSGYGEARLLGSFLRAFQSQLVRAAATSDVIECDDPDVRALVRYGEKQAFLFLWDEAGKSGHQVRLSYTDPETEKTIAIPEAGAVYLPAGGAKILPLDMPIGRGSVRYCTSEVLSLHSVGERTLLVLYGDPDTPGEIALRLPGPPLVIGDVARQKWDPEARTLTLDYYHGSADSYILVDELEIAVLSRQRAAMAHVIAAENQAVTLSAGASITDAILDARSVRAALDCPQGAVELTAALPRRPSSVTLDGQPLEFTFAQPERVLKARITTGSLADERQAKDLWDKLGRAVLGGPPHLYARFDRGSFIPDAKAPSGECASFDTVAGPPEAVGLSGAAFARLRTRFSAQGTAEMLIRGSGCPTLASINGTFVPALSGRAALRRADISPFLRPGLNDLVLMVQILPRARGFAGLSDEAVALPEVRLITQVGEASLEDWQVCPGLAGEAAGYADYEADTRRWHYIRFGPWREQGKDLADVWGPAWYRMALDLPNPGPWTIPYYARVEIVGGGRLYWNGRPLAAVQGDGTYLLPVSAPTTSDGGSNVLAAALYGLSPQTGLYSAEVSADEGLMARRRALEIRF